MSDNIFDAERARRIQNLQQQSVSNIVKQNPNLRSVLSRYEDAEVSRIKLLELQRLRNKKITAGEKALLKAVSKGRGRAGRKGRMKKEQPKQEPEKSQTQIEVEAEERRRKLTQQDRFLQLEDFRQQREFRANERRLEQKELQRATDFISGQNRIQADRDIALFNQLQANARTQAMNDSRTQQAIANRRQNAELAEIKFDLQERTARANLIDGREQRALEQRRIDADVNRYDRDVAVARAQRDAQIEESQNQLAGIQERVARDDAFRHAELQERQQLALENLAQQQRDNTQRHLLEQSKIENQRAVDAERAITDREIIQGFQSQLDALRHQIPPAQIGATPDDVREIVREELRSNPSADLGAPTLEARARSPTPEVRTPRPEQQPQPQPEPQIGGGSGSGTTSSPGTTDFDPDRSPLSAIEQTGSEIATEAQRAAVAGGTRTSPTTQAQRLFLAEQPRKAETQLDDASSNSSLSSTTDDTPLPPSIQRGLSIIGGKDLKLSPDPTQARLYKKGTAGQGPRRGGAGALRGREQPLSPITSSSGSSVSQGTQSELQGRGQVDSLRDTPTPVIGGTTTGGALLQETGNIIGTGLQAAGQAAGGFVGGVAQGIGEQLPTAGQVGAAVGRGGVALVGGVAGAVYEGLRGAEPEQETDP